MLDAPGHLAAPVVITLALWLGATGFVLVRRITTSRDLASTLSSWRLATRGLLPAAGVGAAQAVALMLGLVTAVGVDRPRPVAAVAVAVIAAVAFVALHHGLVAVWGRAGVLASLFLLAVQAASRPRHFPSRCGRYVHSGRPATPPTRWATWSQAPTRTSPARC